MISTRLVAIAVLVALAVPMASASAAGRAVVAISPGGVTAPDLTDTRCPTFSWAAGGNPETVEFVLYRVGERGLESEPMVSLTFPGKATTWTPSLGKCLERGDQYAWSVRALGGETVSDWSTPSFFEVAAGPSEEEFEQAVDVVSRYLASRPQGLEGDEAGTAARDAVLGGSQSVPDAATVNATSAPTGTGIAAVDSHMVIVDPSDDKFLYIQMDTMANASRAFPPATDCDEVNERGRMIWDPSWSGGGGALYICDDSGWVGQAFP